MTDMFCECRALKTIYANSNFSTTSLTSSTGMFSNCTSLVGGNGTRYSASYTGVSYAKIDKSGTKGYFTQGTY